MGTVVPKAFVTGAFVTSSAAATRAPRTTTFAVTTNVAIGFYLFIVATPLIAAFGGISNKRRAKSKLSKHECQVAGPSSSILCRIFKPRFEVGVLTALVNIASDVAHAFILTDGR